MPDSSIEEEEEGEDEDGSEGEKENESQGEKENENDDDDDEDEEEDPESNWIKFKLLLWKNYLVHLANWRNLCFMALTPAMFCIILVMIRCMVTVEIVPAATNAQLFKTFSWPKLIAKMQQRHDYYKEKTGKEIYNVFMPRNIIAYAPDTYEAFKKIMEAVKENLGGIDLKAFDACSKLRETMQKEFYFAGVCFDGSVMNMSTDSIHLVGIYPNHLIFSLVFPSELRIYDDSYLTNHWNTEALFFSKQRDYYFLGSRRNILLSYVREGFIEIQYSISQAYTKLISKSPELPSLRVLPFPNEARKHDMLTENVSLTLPFLVMVSFISPTIYFLKDMIVEKHRITEKLLALLCVRPSMQFLAWVVASYCGLVIASLLLLFQLKIHWNDGFAILTESSSFLLFVFLISYNMSSLCFCYLTAKLFSKPSTGACMMALFWILTYVPFLILVRDHTVDMVVFKHFAYMLPNSVLGLGFQAIIDLEVYGCGLRWGTLFEQQPSNYKLNVGSYILLFFGQTIFYACIALFFSERKDTFASIKGLVQWFRHDEPPRLSSYLGSVTFKTKVFEVEPSYKRALVEFRNVTKEIDGRLVLKDISFNLYEDDCTVLMGHNGAGKSMLMSIAIGLTESTSGSVVIKKDENQPVRRTLVGICISDHLIFNELTVGNQLLLFSRLRGRSIGEAQAEVQEYLKLMELEDKKDVLSRNLTRGIRQHLAVCTALIGDTKVVILDEPTSKIDLTTRKLIWKLLNQEKKGRAILLITQSTEEAEILADRLTIISRGVLRCHGSTYFLRSIYGQGFRLVLYKGPDCNSDRVTELFRKYIPNISPTSDFCAELSYIIDKKYDNVVVPLLNELSNEFNSLNIETCAFSEVTMEDIFFDMGAENPSEGDRYRHKQILNGHSIYSEENKNILFLEDPPEGKRRLLLSQWYALFYKRFRYMMFYKMDIALCFIFFAICTMVSSSVTQGALQSLPIMSFRVKQLQGMTVILESRKGQSELISQIEEQCRQLIFLAQARQIEVPNGMKLLQFLTMKNEEDVFFMMRNVLVGITFQQDSVMAWFNGNIVHAAPLSLNMAFNAILRTVLDSNARIIVNFKPLPFTSPRRLAVPQSHHSIGNFLSITLAICLCYLGSQCIIFIVKEQASRAKLLQLIAGTSLWTFWLSTYFSDFVLVLCTAVVPTVMVIISNDPVFRLPFVIGSFFPLFILTGLAIASVNYAFAIHFKSHYNAYMAATSFHAFGFVSVCVYLSVFATNFLEPLDIHSSLEWFVRMFPLFSFCSAFTNIYVIGMTNILCTEDTVRHISIDLENCECNPNCCVYKMWHIHSGILFEYLYLVLVIVISWLIVACCENIFRFSCRDTPSGPGLTAINFYQLLHGQMPQVEVSDDVYREQMMVNVRTKLDHKTDTLICKRVVKMYHGVPIVNEVSFYLEPSDCFAVLGPNGSGKSTLLQMIVGYKGISNGNVLVNDTSLKTNPRNAFKHVGYSAALTTMYGELTCFEVLKFFCMLRGTEPHRIEAVCENLAKLLGIFKHYHVRLNNCSEGIVMRVNFAVAIMKKPALLCLDMPMAHVDEVGCRQLWNVLNALRRQNKTTVIFSSLVTRECQLYCNKMAIMHNGHFCAIGSTIELAERHPEGYCIYLKMKGVTKINPSLFMKTFFKLTTFMEQHFPTSRLLDYYCNILIFFIPLAESDIAQIFDLIPNNMYNLNLETFHISRETLYFIYLNSVEEQKQYISEMRSSFI